MSEQESLRKALAWLLEQQTSQQAIDSQLISEAARRFDCSPLDEAFLQNYFVKPPHE